MKKAIVLPIIMVLVVPFVFGKLTLENIEYDPAVISSGDEVDIIIGYSEEGFPVEDKKLGNANYRYSIKLEPDDKVTREHITVLDSEGDHLYKNLVQHGETYKKKFRVKVDTDAPALEYQFKLIGQWHKNDTPVGNEQIKRFRMPVKREGIILGVGSLSTEPAEVRSGDDFVKLSTSIENSGEKAAKTIEVRLDTPQEIEPSYSNNNRQWIGVLKSKGSKNAEFYIDINDSAEPGVYNITYQMDYMDMDDNGYSKNITVPFRVKSSPDIEVVETNGSGAAGGNHQLRVELENTGSESAESVDVRLLKQSSQPFTYDVRSDYVGEIKPGEKGTAIFNVNVLSNAKVKEHHFDVLIRAKGDSDEGDDNIYTFSRRATFEVTEKKFNPWVIGGIALLVVVVGAFFVSRKMKGGSK